MESVTANGYIADGDRAINADTGEIHDDGIWVYLKSGSTVITPEDRMRNIQAKQDRLEREMWRRRGKERYYFVRSDTGFEDMSPAMVTRLIYLSTYSRFKDNQLMLSERKPMERKDLKDVLRISRSNAWYFWKEVSPEYVSENDGGLYLNADRFKRGSLKKKSYTPYQQFYDAGVRRLYEACDGRYHKQLGYLFNLLPYINIEYNILCYEPWETDIDKIRPMTLSEFCGLIGYDVSNIGKLLSVYKTVRFDVNGEQQRFCSLIGIDRPDSKICINPAVLYAGSNIGRVEVTRLYFKE